MKKIVVSGEKGGVGKSTFSCLLTEWLIHNRHLVSVIDADPNETTREWIAGCAEQGRQVTCNGAADYQVIDTAGRSGSGLRFLNEADLVLAPFQPQVADVSRVVSWFVALHPRLQQKVAFIPNRIRAASATTEQRAGVAEIERLVSMEGCGRLILPGVADRPAVYGPLLEGSGTCFFEQLGCQSLRSAQWEMALVLGAALKPITETT
jgi:cellulose biosynthesis protein BcsQ